MYPEKFTPKNTKQTSKHKLKNNKSNFNINVKYDF